MKGGDLLRVLAKSTTWTDVEYLSVFKENNLKLKSILFFNIAKFKFEKWSHTEQFSFETVKWELWEQSKSADTFR